MVYIALNVILIGGLIALAILMEKKGNFDIYNGNVFIFPILVAIVEVVLFTIVLICKTLWRETVTDQLMKIAFVIDGVFFSMLSIQVMGLGVNIRKLFIRIIEVLLCVSTIFFVYSKFTEIDVSVDYYITIDSEYLFEGPAQEFFPLTWSNLFTIIYKVLVPGICYLFYVFEMERKGNQLQRYQAGIIGEAYIFFWLMNFFLMFVQRADPGFSALYMYAYFVMLVVMLIAASKTVVPSGKGIAAGFVTSIVSYIVPAAVIGFAIMFIQPMDGEFTLMFFIEMAAISALVILFSLRIARLITRKSSFYTANYGPALERDLGTIDYSGEMEEITKKIHEIFTRNAESSSVNVYILGQKNKLDIAYSSNGMKNQISLSNPIFDTLLNINKPIVCWNQIGNDHDIIEINDELTKFFEETKSDAMFILNEGHDIIGLITLGKKISGDHYKEYDYNVFTSLYSYFFVFGYYMRNISNKDIIGTVNREIRMSSQIITSIQENIEHVKNPNLDVGYLMVPSHNIGGEFIDMIRLTDTRHLFVVGDMSGKGIAASMNMVILKSIIRTYLAETHDFKELIVKLNNFVRDSLHKGTIFAGLFALIDFETDTMYYINCGVPALMLYTQVYNNVIEIQGAGHVLGFVKDLTPFISVKSTKLNPGDIILACTDGLVQSHSLRGEQFGKERIQQCLLDNSTYPAQRMAQFTFDNLLKFMSKEMEDDVSILVMKYKSSIDYSEQEETEDTSAVKEASAENEVADGTVEAKVPAGAENPAEETVDSEMAVAEDESVDVEAAAIADSEQAAVAEVAGSAAEISEAAASAEEAVPAEGGMDIPDDPDIPDLSNLDEMLKMAGL